MSLEVKRKSRNIHLCSKKFNNKIIDTLHVLDKIIGATLGPGGKPVILDRPASSPMFTKDGVTVAEAVSFSDALSYVISESAKEACSRTNTEAGDGTTTAIVLAHALVKEGIRALRKNPFTSPQALCRELDEVFQTCIYENLENQATPITMDDLKKVAMVSSNFDEEISDAVVEAVMMVGEDGTIITEESSGRGMAVEKREGFPFAKGLSTFGSIQSIFMNNPQDQECQFENAYILLYDGDALSPSEVGVFLGGCFEAMKQNNDIRPIIMIAHKFSPQVIKMFAQNVQMNTAYVCPLETFATAQPNSKHDLLHDLAAFSGATVLDPLTNTFSKAAQTKAYLKFLGECTKTKIGKYKSVLLDGHGAGLMERIDSLRSQMDKAESDYDRELIKERMGFLAGGIANIYVGGSSDIEIRERKHRIEDTINAIRSAMEGGVITGGGVPLLCISKKLQEGFSFKKIFNRDKLSLAKKILSKACETPFRRIMENAGCSNREIKRAMKRVINCYGVVMYDSLAHKFINSLESGIIDPTKVTLHAFKNALSVAKLLMTSGGAIILPRDVQEERDADKQARDTASQMMG